MSLALLREICAAHPELPDHAHGFDAGESVAHPKNKIRTGRIRALDVVAACDEIPLERVEADKGRRFGPYFCTVQSIRLGSANLLREQPTDEKKAAVFVIIPIGYLRHLLKVAGIEWQAPTS